MKKINRWTAFLTALCMAAGLAVSVAACDGEAEYSSSEELESSSSEVSSSEISGSSSSFEEDPFASDETDTRLYLTVSIKTDEGELLPGVTFRVTSNATTVATITTNEDGRATCRLDEGVYTVRFADGLPENHYPAFYSQEVELVENITVMFTAVNEPTDDSDEALGEP